MTMAVADDCSECDYKNLVWVSSKKEGVAAKVDSVSQRLYLRFHRGGSLLQVPIRSYSEPSLSPFVRSVVFVM